MFNNDQKVKVTNPLPENEAWRNRIGEVWENDVSNWYDGPRLTVDFDNGARQFHPLELEAVVEVKAKKAKVTA